MGLKKLKTLNNWTLRIKDWDLAREKKQIFKSAFHCFTLLKSLTTYFSQKS